MLKGLKSWSRWKPTQNSGNSPTTDGMYWTTTIPPTNIDSKKWEFQDCLSNQDRYRDNWGLRSSKQWPISSGSMWVEERGWQPQKFMTSKTGGTGNIFVSPNLWLVRNWRKGWTALQKLCVCTEFPLTSYAIEGTFSVGKSWFVMSKSTSWGISPENAGFQGILIISLG